MYQMTLRILLVFAVAAQLSLGLAASPAIGVAQANGNFLIDDAEVVSNGTLFEGSVLETKRASSEILLGGNMRMDLATGSKGQVFRDRLVLKKGAGAVESGTPFSVEARGLQVVSGAGRTAARVSLEGENFVQIAAVLGNLRVMDSNGILLAALPAGRALGFDTQASGASAPTTVVGEVSKEDGLYYVTDETTGVKFEVQGENLEGLVGQRVSVTGTIVPSSTAGAAQILQVTGVEKLSVGGAAGGSATGMSAATKTVIAGVAIAGAGTAAGVGLTRGDDEKTPMSR